LKPTVHQTNEIGAPHKATLSLPAPPFSFISFSLRPSN